MERFFVRCAVVAKFKLLLFLFFSLLSIQLKAQLFSIPEKQIILNDILPQFQGEKEIKLNVNAFELSKQVTLKEYKVFLSDILKDSGKIAYQKFLPDTSIAPKELYKKYFETSSYDDFPVVGISWDNALGYCKWMTLKNNSSDTLNCIYRLPNLYEYFSAYIHLQQKAIDNDLNASYSDWLMDTHDESLFTYGQEMSLSYYYFHLSSDFPVMKRKMVIGKSFRFAFNSLADYLRLSYYADHGYSHIGFRLVKDTSADSFEKDLKKYKNPLLQYWNIKPKSK